MSDTPWASKLDWEGYLAEQIKLKKATEPDSLKQRFAYFLCVVWDHLGLPVPTSVQIDVADFLQYGPPRSVVEAFRGVGKSWVTSAFVLWKLYCDPDIKVFVASASKERASDFTTFLLRLINEMPELQHLAPTEDQRNSKISFDVGPSGAAHAPSVKSVGITGQLTGSRADLIVADDVEVPNNSATQVMRDKLSEAVKEFDAIIKTAEDSPHRQIVYLGTPQCEESLYSKLPDRGYVVRIWPARYPTKKLMTKYADKLAFIIRDPVEADPTLVGRPTDPKRFTDLDLIEREASYGRSGFALQFMLDTSLSDQERYPLKLADLIVMSLDPKLAPVKVAWGGAPELVVNDVPNVGFSGDRFYRPAWVAKDDFAPYQGTVMMIDPSGRGKDECGYAVVSCLHGMLYLKASGGFLQGYTPDTLTSLCEIAKKHQVNLIQIEANFGDGMFTQLLKPVSQAIYPVQIEEVKHSVQKEKRIIDTLEPILNQHRLVVSPEVIKADFESTKDLPQEDALRYQLFYQLTRLTKEKGSLVRDDRLDALAMAVHYWVEALAQNVDRAVDAHRQKLLDIELESFLQHATGQKPAQKGWLPKYGTRTSTSDLRNQR
jgi:hypothetical protein